MFEQLFQLYEQKLPKRAERDFRRGLWVDPRKYEYKCAASSRGPPWQHPSSQPELPHLHGSPLHAPGWPWSTADHNLQKLPVVANSASMAA